MSRRLHLIEKLFRAHQYSLVFGASPEIWSSFEFTHALFCASPVKRKVLCAEPRRTTWTDFWQIIQATCRDTIHCISSNFEKLSVEILEPRNPVPVPESEWESKEKVDFNPWFLAIDHWLLPYVACFVNGSFFWSWTRDHKHRYRSHFLFCHLAIDLDELPVWSSVSH